jgi:hypothetical protein
MATVESCGVRSTHLIWPCRSISSSMRGSRRSAWPSSGDERMRHCLPWGRPAGMPRARTAWSQPFCATPSSRSWSFRLVLAWRAQARRHNHPMAREWAAGSRKLVPDAHRSGLNAGPCLGHGHEAKTKTERTPASGPRGAGPPPGAQPRDPVGARRRRCRACSCRCASRDRLGTGLGGRRAGLSAVLRLDERSLRPGRLGERPKPHERVQPPASAAAAGGCDDSHPSTLADRSPIA